MKTFVRSIIITLLLGVCLESKSQSLAIDSGLTNLVISLPDTIFMNSNYNHYIGIQYSGSTPFTDTIYLMGAIDSSGVLISVDTIGSVAVTNFANGDTVGIGYNEVYSPGNGYKMGGNVIVVWPIANNLITTDSVSDSVIIIPNPLGIENSELLKRPLIYPNPTSNFIYLTNFQGNYAVKQVRIYDLNGRMVYDKGFRPKIDVTTLPKGIYILKIGLKDEELHYKLIKH